MTLLDRLTYLEGEARKPPWTWQPEYRDEDDGDTGSFVHLLAAKPHPHISPPESYVLAHRTYWHIREADADLIAEARNALPMLLQALRAAHEYLLAIDPYHLDMDSTPMEAHNERDRTESRLKDSLERLGFDVPGRPT